MSPIVPLCVRADGVPSGPHVQYVDYQVKFPRDQRIWCPHLHQLSEPTNQ